MIVLLDTNPPLVFAPLRLLFSDNYGFNTLIETIPTASDPSPTFRRKRTPTYRGPVSDNLCGPS